MHSSSCLYIGSPKSYSSISDPSEFLLTSIAFATAPQWGPLVYETEYPNRLCITCEVSSDALSEVDG